MKIGIRQGIKLLWKSPKGHLYSPHGGKCEWDPPKPLEDGSYEPGDWTDPVSDPYRTVKGYHITTTPAVWWDKNNLRAFLAEGRGDRDGDPSQTSLVAYESCRLLRPLTAEELKSYGIVIEGVHEYSKDILVAAGTAEVRGIYFTGNTSWFDNSRWIYPDYTGS